MTKKTLEELQETHSEMLATAHDLGLVVPEELKTNFTDQKAGGTVCKHLDALIREHRSKGVAESEKMGQGEASAPESSAEKTEEEKPVAKKTKSKAKTKKSKKAAATKSGSSKRRAAFSEDAKITWAGKDNPAREGSAKFDRIDNVRKHNGKTVKTYRSTGRNGTLGWCVENGLAKVG